MKQLAAIMLLFTFLSANSPLGEVLKLPMLVHHYTEHEQLEHKVSFIDFLMEHYTSPLEHGDYAHHHHDNLPFKSVSNHFSQIVTLIPKIPNNIGAGGFLSDQSGFPAYCSHNYTNICLNQIWQPPRLS